MISSSSDRIRVLVAVAVIFFSLPQFLYAADTINLVQSLHEMASLPDLSTIDFGTLRIGDLFLDGFETNSRWGRKVTVNWVNKQRAILKLPQCNVADKILFLRMLPFTMKDSPDQWCELKINNHFLHRIRLERNWWSYEVVIPASMLDPRQNILELQFSYVEDANKPEKTYFFAVDEELQKQTTSRLKLPHKPKYRAAAIDYIILYDLGINLQKRSDRFFNTFIVAEPRTFQDREFDTILYYPQGKITFIITVKPGDHLRFIPIGWIIRPQSQLQDTVAFQVLLTDPRDVTHILFSETISAGAEQDYSEVNLDLSLFKGQKVILSLQTTIDKPFGRETILGLWGDPVIYNSDSQSSNSVIQTQFSDPDAGTE